MMQEKRKVSAEIKTYIGGILLNQEPYNGQAKEQYQAWTTAVGKRYSFLGQSPEEAIAIAVYDRGMKEEFKADRSIWTAFCCASVSLQNTRQFLATLLRIYVLHPQFNLTQNKMTEEENERFDPYLSKYQHGDMETAIAHNITRILQESGSDRVYEENVAENIRKATEKAAPELGKLSGKAREDAERRIVAKVREESGDKPSRNEAFKIADESWFPMVLHFEREIERNAANYLQHIIAQLRDTYGEIPFPNSPREAVMIMKQKLNMQ